MQVDQTLLHFKFELVLKYLISRLFCLLSHFEILYLTTLSKLLCTTKLSRFNSPVPNFYVP